jgi:AcrR family transcriptional regulator
MTQRRRGRPPGRTKAETRQRILGAARRCFGTYGYDAATNRLIADESGISPGAIYQHFASKAELYAAVDADCHRSILKAYALATATTADLRAAILAIIDTARELHEREPVLAQFVIAHPVEVRRHADLAHLPSWADTKGPLRSVAARAGAEQKLPPDVTPGVMTDALWVVHLGLGRFAQASDDLGSYFDAVEACKRLFTLSPSRGPRGTKRQRVPAPKPPSRQASRRTSTAMVVDDLEVEASPTERALIAAAVESFAERGYASTTLQEIVARAGLTTGAVYGRFASKQALFIAAVNYVVAVVENSLRAAVAPYPGLDDRIGAYLDAMVELSLQPNLLAFRMTLPVELARSAELAEAIGDELERRLQLCRGIITSARRGSSSLDLEDLATLMVIVGDGLAWDSAAGGRATRLAPALHRLLLGELLP